MVAVVPLLGAIKSIDESSEGSVIVLVGSQEGLLASVLLIFSFQSSRPFYLLLFDFGICQKLQLNNRAQSKNSKPQR